ncbi:hypothetical protein SRHO_G00124260 [Serrasalmus rhombeus]
MLGESFIHLLKYRQEDAHSPDITRASFTPPTNSRQDPYSLSKVKDIPLPVKPALSDVKHVEKRSGYIPPKPSPDLYLSKPCVSLSQSLEPSNALYEKCQTNPLQLSSLSDSKEFHIDSVEQQEWHTSNVDDSSPKQLRFIPQQADVPDDGYLVMDSSIMLNGEPPTNSMINGYLDRKLQEVYSQYLQERLACPGSSPGCSLLPLLPQPSLPQLSQQAYLDSSLDIEARPNQMTHNVTTSQGHHSQRVSSAFSSPVLRISNVEQPKRPGHCDSVVNV